MDKKPTNGFTLIEILFVIAIMAVVAGLSLSFYQQTTVSSKVSKTALQMQQILQAASAYYIANQNQAQPWPTSIDQKNPDFQVYLPIGSTTSPWGSAYPPYSANPPFVDGAYNNKLFQVSVTVPSTAIAERIAGILPSGQATDTTVISQVGIPGQTIVPPPPTPAYTIAKVGLATSGTQISFNCPTNTNACVYPATTEVHNVYAGGRRGFNLPINNMGDIVTYCEGQSATQQNASCTIITKMCGSSYYYSLTGANKFLRIDISEPTISQVAFYLGVCQADPCNIVTPDAGDTVACTLGNTKSLQ